MTSSKCGLQRTPSQKASLSVLELVRMKAAECEPVLAWAEPDPLQIELSNDTGRRADFVPLARGAPPWKDDLPLVEARLFWGKSALHVVAREGGGCIWTRFEEVKSGGDADVTRTETEVHTLRDRKRFGLQDQHSIEGLRAIEYRCQGRLIAWRLVIGAK